MKPAGSDRRGEEGQVDRNEWNRRYDTPDLVWTGEANRFLVTEMSAMPAGTALDLAAGEGRNAVWLARRGWTVTAVDFADVGLAKAARLAASAGVEVDLVCADVTEYEPAPASFDLVVVLYLHLPTSSRRPLMAMAARSLAPGGTLLVVGHDATNLTAGYGGPQDPDVLFSPDDVVEDLTESDLVVIKAARVERPVDTADGPRVAIDALVRARRPAGPGGP